MSDLINTSHETQIYSKARNKLKYDNLIKQFPNLVIYTTEQEWLISNKNLNVKIKAKCSSDWCDNIIIATGNQMKMKNSKNRCKECNHTITYIDLLNKLSGKIVLTTESEWLVTDRTGNTMIKVQCKMENCDNEILGNIHSITRTKFTNKCKKCTVGITYEELLSRLPNINIFMTEQEWKCTSMTLGEVVRFECTTINCSNEASTSVRNISNHTQQCFICVRKTTYAQLLDKLPNIIVKTTEQEWNASNQNMKETITIQCSMCDNDMLVCLNHLEQHSKKCKKCVSIISYEELINKFPDLTIKTKKIEWIDSNQNCSEIIKFECTNFGCTNEVIMEIVYIYQHHKQCKECVAKKTSIIMSEKNTDINGNKFCLFHTYETELIDKLNIIFKDIFILKKAVDGCKCDVYLKPIDVVKDEWLQIQIKSSKQDSSKKYCFGMNNNSYNDMIIMLHHFGDNKYWLINGDSISNINGIYINNNKTLKNDKYNEYEVQENELVKSLTIFYETKKLFPENTILEQLGPENLIEHKHRIKREKLLQEYLKFELPKTDNMVYDLFVNNFKVQDKSGTNNGKSKHFCFTIKRRNKKWYKKDDNNFYWLYNTKNSMFLVIPEYELLKEGIVKDDSIPNQELKSSFMINFNKYKNHAFANYVFDYDNIDIPKLTNLLKPIST